MHEVITTTIITAAVSVITAVISYKQGAKKSEAEALKTAFESYHFALASLRQEFEQRTQYLMERIKTLENENKELRNKLAVVPLQGVVPYCEGADDYFLVSLFCLCYRCGVSFCLCRDFSLRLLVLNLRNLLLASAPREG